MFKATTTSANILDEVVVFIKKIALTFVAIIFLSMFLGLLTMAFDSHDTSGIATCIMVVGLMAATVWAVWMPSKQK